jgi:phage FluMu protein Com
MSQREVKCPRCGDAVSIHRLNCGQCNKVIEEGKSKEWIEKSPATDSNLELYVLYMVPHAVLTIQQLVKQMLRENEKIDNETWGKIFMWSFSWAKMSLERNKGEVPTIAQVAVCADWMIRNTTLDSPFGKFLIEQIGLTRTQSAIESLALTNKK